MGMHGAGAQQGGTQNLSRSYGGPSMERVMQERAGAVDPCVGRADVA